MGAGASVIGVGSDIGGSIRIPCFFNGVFGHKPSTGKKNSCSCLHVLVSRIMETQVECMVSLYTSHIVVMLIKVMRNTEYICFSPYIQVL